MYLEALSLFLKKNDETYVFTLPFNKFKVGTPNALSKGMYNYNLLSQLTYHVRNTSDFNQLPIPFSVWQPTLKRAKKLY